MITLAASIPTSPFAHQPDHHVSAFELPQTARWLTRKAKMLYFSDPKQLQLWLLEQEAGFTGFDKTLDRLKAESSVKETVQTPTPTEST